MHGTHEKHGPKLLKRSMRADESGMALIYVTIALPVIIGFALLAIDVGRYMTLNSSLQHGADALALAGAAELDGRSDAITRANSAMQLFVTDNTALFTSSAAAVNYDAVDRCYLAALPASDATPIDPKDCLSTATGDIATSSGKAMFVQVKVKPKNYNTVFPATFLGALTNTVSTSAEAVAGFEAAACNFTPMFICNPYEPATATVNDPANARNPYGVYDYVKNPADRRRQIAFKTQTNQWGPGNFGFLSGNWGNGAPGLVTQILMDKPTACFRLKSLELDTQTGNLQSVSASFNVRFDLYEKNSFPGGVDPKAYNPAPNVRKGYVPTTSGNNVDYCKQSPDVAPYSKARGFGVDKCFTTTTPDSDCFKVNGTTNPRIGKGDWDFDSYWNFNFPSTTAKPTDANGVAYSTSNPPSRYDVYKYEIAQSLTNQKVSGVEVGTPMCVNTASALGADRRIIYGAIINCRAADVGGKTKGIQAVAFGKFFLTNPMSKESICDASGKNCTDRWTLWAELADIVRPGDGSGVTRDMVQLYR